MFYKCCTLEGNIEYYQSQHRIFNGEVFQICMPSGVIFDNLLEILDAINGCFHNYRSHMKVHSQLGYKKGVSN